MTRIDTRIARKHWGDETKYLEKIHYVAIAEDGENISLLADEEGNYETILTPKSAKYVALILNGLADQINKKKLEVKK